MGGMMPGRESIEANLSWTLVDVFRNTTAVLQMTSSSDLWLGCAQWLRDLGVLTETNQRGTLVEFASILRDGVLLCRLANALIPNAIDMKDVTKTAQMSQWSCTKNLNLFFDFCRRELKIRDEDLFTPEDMFYMTGFEKCLNFLSKLSQSPIALSKNITPFPENRQMERNSPSTSSQETFEDEDIYQSLTDNIENIDPNQTIYGPINTTDPDEQHNEQLYDHIVMVRKSSINEGDASPQIKKMKCLKELYETEINYVDQALVTIIENFYKPLKGIIPPLEYQTIFGNIEAIEILHKQLIADMHYPVALALGKADAIPPRPTSLMIEPPKYIGEVFVKYRDGFLEYGHYCSNLPKSREISNNLLATNAFIKKNVDELTQSGKCKFSMNDLLCVPFQRLTKYPLLLKELLKKTDISSPDKDSLIAAQEAMEDVCAYINEQSRDTSTQKMIAEIEKSIVDLSMPKGVQLKDYGRVNLDGEVRMAENIGNQVGKPKQRYVFLFDKVLVVCKATAKISQKELGAKNNNFTYKNAFVISDLNIDMNITIDAKSSGTITRRTQYVIHLHRERAEPNEVNHLAFYFKNDSIREKWLKEFIRAKSNVCPTELIKDTHHKVTYTSFKVDVKRPEVCGICDKLMKGLYYQGYKCEGCNMAIHKDCLAVKKCNPIRRPPSFSTPRQSFSVARGDIVVATCSFSPSDLSYLQFKKDDQIEVTQLHSQSRFTGCLLNNPQRTGLVNIDRVTRLPRTPSMIGQSPQDSPAGSIFLKRKESTVLPQKPHDSIKSDGSSLSIQRPSSIIDANRQDYVNTEITEQPWYMGDMERKTAESTLRGTPNGTFLVRYSRNRSQIAISLSFRQEIKHMIIEQNKDGKVYLDEDYIFNSIVELVQYYREHSLLEIFVALDTTLRNPYLTCKIYIAIHDYEAQQAHEGKFLSFRAGDRVVLIDTVGEDRGWWKGQANNQTGFFPLSYVQPMENVDADDVAINEM